MWSNIRSEGWWWRLYSDPADGQKSVLPARQIPWLQAQRVSKRIAFEAHYSKEEILEFYEPVSRVGQRTGRIALSIFFNKTPAQLSSKNVLLRMVKAPSRYNPFSGSVIASQGQGSSDGPDYLF